jgi:hypothetical protein
MHRASLLTLVVASVACGPGRSTTSQASDSAATDSLLASLARDTTIMHTPSRDPSDDAVERLLDRLLPPRDPALMRVDTGCVIGGASRERDDTLPRPVPPHRRVTCRMRGDAERVDLDLAVDGNGNESLRLLDVGSDSTRQSIALDDLDSPVHDGTPDLLVVDLDGDGTGEVLVLEAAGATGNLYYHGWRYDGAARRLVVDTALSALANVERIAGRPCIRQWATGGGANRWASVECFAGGRWMPVWSSGTQHDTGKRTVFRSVVVWLRGVQHVVRGDSIPDARWEDGVAP